MSVIGQSQPARPQTRFVVPDGRAAAEPPEARGLARDGVRLLAATTGKEIEQARFFELDRFLKKGDLLVVNTSATRAAAVEGRHARLGPVIVHLSTPLDDDSWVIELRTAPSAQLRVSGAEPGDRVRLPDGTDLVLASRYPNDSAVRRLWRTRPVRRDVVRELTARYGRPIRYGYLSGEWPLADYQTVFADDGDGGDGDDGGDGEAGAEMPSAGRPFSRELVARLKAKGVLFAPITLHCGVSSLETGEPPLPERFEVTQRTASLVNGASGRVIAVGTTVTRALESATDAAGRVQPAGGWTDLVLGPEHPVRVVTGLITGMHDPDASHLLLLEAVAGCELVQRSYDAALEAGWLWHEFGDSCLLLP